MGPALRVRIPPPKQASRKRCGNGEASEEAGGDIRHADDPELEPEPTKPPFDEELGDEIDF